MREIIVEDLINVCKGILIKGNKNVVLQNFSKDTRTLKKEDIYIGIKGDNFDGNLLYEEALKNGAKGCILNENIQLEEDVLKNYPNIFIVLVKDTIKALQELASFKRDLYNIPVIGVTGSVGKTSTKDIIASVLSKKYRVLKTEGNYNNHLGVPLTILRLQKEEALVIEMGMNNLGEIATLSKIAKPTVGVITNVGTAHIGNLKTRKNILKAKLEILEGMDKEGLLVINNDNDLLHKWYLENAQQYKIITFGIENKSDYFGVNIKEDRNGSEYQIATKENVYQNKVSVPGKHFVLNSLCAYAIGNIFQIDKCDIADGCHNFELTKRRMEVNVIKEITIINDCYNANYDSMKMSLNYLGNLKGRKVAVLGSMLELGTFSKELHQKVGQEVINNKIDVLITIGKEAMVIAKEWQKYNLNNVYVFLNIDEALEKIKRIIKREDNILLKASNGMNFGKLYDDLVEYLKYD